MHSWLLTRFSPVARAEFFPDDRPWALTPAPLAPTGTLRVVDGGYRNSGYSADTVAYTSPGAGSQIASGTTITIYRSNGTPYVPPHAHGNHGPANHEVAPGTGFDPHPHRVDRLFPARRVGGNSAFRLPGQAAAAIPANGGLQHFRVVL